MTTRLGMKSRCSFALCAALALSAFIPTPAGADESSAIPQDELKTMAESIRQQGRSLLEQQESLDKQWRTLQQQQQELEEQQRKFLLLQQRMEALTGEPLPQLELSRQRGAGKSAPKDGAPTDDVKTNSGKPMPERVGTDRKPDEPEKPPEIATYIEEGGVLLPKGKIVVTPAIEYTNSSATRVAIEGFSIIPALNIGLFEITQVTRNTLNGSLSARLGITNRFEIDTKIPYLYRNDSTRSRQLGVPTSDEVLNDITGNGIGDVEFGAHYQINRGRDGWPFFIGNMRFKTTTGTSPFEVATDPSTGLQTELPTGSGFYALQPSVTMIYPSDPVVYYSNIGYLLNFKDNVGGTTGNIDPGDSISASFGMSLGLNDRSSFSLGYSHNTVLRTKQNGVLLPNTQTLQIGTLDFTFSHRLYDWMNLNLNVSAGLTEDAPDARVTFRVPMSYQLF